MKQAVDYLEKRIKIILSRSKGKPIFVVVAGRSASGKSYLVNRLVLRFKCQSIRLRIDDYYMNLPDVTKGFTNGLINWDKPSVIKIDLFNKHIATLATNRPIKKPIYNMQNSSSINMEAILPQNLILVDGAHALNSLFKIPSSLKIFVYSEENKCLKRRLRRDATERRKGSKREIEEYFYKIATPAFHEYIEPTIKKANVIVYN